MDKNNKQERRQKVRDFIDANSKSPLAGAIYALIYGPFGLVYVNPKLAITALLCAVALGFVYWPLIGLLWLACVVAAPYQVRTYNSRIRRSARYLVT
jgi:hypothetical protein